MESENVRKLEDGSVAISVNDAGGKTITVTLEGNNLKVFLSFLSARQPGAAIVFVSELVKLSIGNAQVVVDAFADSTVGKQMRGDFKSASGLEVQSAQSASAPVQKVRVPFVSRTSEGGVHITIKNGDIDLHRGGVGAIVSAYSIGGEQAMAIKLRAEMHDNISEETASDCIRAFLESEVGRDLVGSKGTEDKGPRTGARFILSAWSVALLAAAFLTASNSGIRNKDDQGLRTKQAIASICRNAGLTAGQVNSRRLFC